MNIKEIWEHAVSYIRQEIPSVVGFNTYIRDIRPVSYENGIFKVSVSTALIKNMVKIRYTDLIEKSVARVTAEPVMLEIVLESEVIRTPEIVVPQKEQIAVPEEPTFVSNLNPRYVFDTFVVGSSNEYATAIAKSVAQNPGQGSNPLFLYGNSGLGKTHLMHAIGNEILKNSPEKKVVYVTSERFTNDMINSLRDRDKDMEAFRRRYREVDVLLVDDVQFIEGKEGTQEEFFHTFNDLYLKNKQIVLTSDRSPKELVTLEERLRTRFEWGVQTDIITPDYETRVAILKKKAENQNTTVSIEVLSYIAERVSSNIRELEGALLKIMAYAGISHKPIDMELAEEALRSILPEDRIVKVTPQKILDKVSSFYNVSQEDIIGKSKTKNIVLPRQIVMYLCKKMTNMNFGMIAAVLGNRDRTTVMYGADKIVEMMEEDENLKADIDYIMKDLNTIS